MSMKPEALIFADDRPTSVCDDLYQWAIDAEDLIRRMQAENEDLRDTVQFVERWAVHHGTKGCMSATETLSAIQHYPGIAEVTDGYADGKRPATFNPYARIAELEAAATAPVPQGWKLVPAEPTENMYMCVGYYKDDPAIAKRVIRRDYQAMLAAAPAHPAEGVPAQAVGEMTAERAALAAQAKQGGV